MLRVDVHERELVVAEPALLHARDVAVVDPALVVEVVRLRPERSSRGERRGVEVFARAQRRNVVDHHIDHDVHAARVHRIHQRVQVGF